MKNLVIFRVPDHEDKLWLREHDYTDGKLSEQFREFTVVGEDWYLFTDFYHIILAEKIEGGSVNASRFAISADGQNDDAIIHELELDEIEKIVGHIITNEVAH